MYYRLGSLDEDGSAEARSRVKNHFIYGCVDEDILGKTEQQKPDKMAEVCRFRARHGALAAPPMQCLIVGVIQLRSISCACCEEEEYKRQRWKSSCGLP